MHIQIRTLNICVDNSEALQVQYFILESQKGWKEDKLVSPQYWMLLSSQ